jgi:hypothetical protein
MTTLMNKFFYFGSLILVLLNIARTASAETLTYKYSGAITNIFLNEDNVIPDLAVGDAFTGYVSFESTGWHHTEGTVFVSLNGVDLLFTGNYIYGEVNVQLATNYSIRIAGDTGGDISGSTFSAGNFGPDLEDTDGSGGYSIPFPIWLDLNEFETNVFLLSGGFVDSKKRLSATGRLTEFFAVPEPSSVVLVAFGAYGIGLIRKRRKAPSMN